MSASQESSETEALRYISDARFHREFTLLATSDHEALNVSFADLGRSPSPDSTVSAPPTILYMPGMFASRYLGVAMHAVAEKLGVRVLIVDRPGMGKSTDVPLQQRVSVWVELVPRLLEHLGIQHVSLVSHSSGTVFLLNTLYQCRGILYPEKPFVALLAPWVDPSHSKVTSMQLAQYLPVSVFSIWHLIPEFFLLKAGPAFASSGAVVTKASNIMSSVSGLSTSQQDSALDKNQKKIERDYGMPIALQTELNQQVFKSMFEEDTVGANSEALQCLKKGNWSWGKCSNYAQYVRDLADKERTEGISGAKPRLKVRAYFAETDDMIGRKGQAYMEECWKGSNGEFQDVLDFETTTVVETDHDTVTQSVDVLSQIFIQAGGTAINEGSP